MGKTNVTIYMKGYYEEFYGFGWRENKANTKPNKAKLRWGGYEIGSVQAVHFDSGTFWKRRLSRGLSLGSKGSL